MPNTDQPAIAPSYIELANVTMSDQWHGANISKADFVCALQDSVTALERLDKIKKALFYGRPLDTSGSGPTIETLDLDITPVGISIKDGRRLIHGLIGSATEAGEKLEAILKAIDDTTELDLPNVLEEVGDGLWYDAAVMRVAGKTFEDVQGVNIAKLQTRFPDGFSSFHANNRDLDAERQILVDGAQSPS
jgi:NTP pyrophosphatase (non-canonical NTP hydrolase)